MPTHRTKKIKTAVMTLDPCRIEEPAKNSHDVGTDAACANLVYAMEDGVMYTAEIAYWANLVTLTTTDIKGFETCAMMTVDEHGNSTNPWAGDWAVAWGLDGSDTIICKAAHTNALITACDTLAGVCTSTVDGESETCAAEKIDEESTREPAAGGVTCLCKSANAFVALTDSFLAMEKDCCPTERVAKNDADPTVYLPACSVKDTKVA